MQYCNRLLFRELLILFVRHGEENGAETFIVYYQTHLRDLKSELIGLWVVS